MGDPEKKGCWVFCSPPVVDGEDFYLTTPDGTVHRPEMNGTLVSARAIGNQFGNFIEFEIQIPGEPNRKVRAPSDTIDIEWFRKLFPVLA